MSSTGGETGTPRTFSGYLREGQRVKRRSSLVVGRTVSEDRQIQQIRAEVAHRRKQRHRRRIFLRQGRASGQRLRRAGKAPRGRIGSRPLVREFDSPGETGQVPEEKARGQIQRQGLVYLQNRRNWSLFQNLFRGIDDIRQLDKTRR